MRWLLFALSILTCNAQAQSPFSIRHLTTSHGLTQGSCYYIKKDSRGFVWISSQNGLNRFDGARFTNYLFDEQDSTTIGKGEVRGIVEAPSGDLWVGTEECLNQYVRRTDTFRRIYATDAQGKRLPALQEPFFVDDSTVWYASNQEGIMRLNYLTGKKTRINPSIKPKFSITTEWIDLQPNETFLVYLLPAGFATYNYRTHQLKTFLTGQSTDQTFSNQSSIPARKSLLFQSLHRCQKPGPHYGNYCLAGPDGILEFDATLSRLIRHHPIRPNASNFRLVSMDEDKKGNWWIGAEGLGIWLYDPNTMKLLQEITPGSSSSNSLLTNQIATVYVDNLGLVWTNSDPFGVDIIYPNAYTIETIADNPIDITDLNNHPIRGLCEDKGGKIWIGTVDGGIRLYNPKNATMRAYTLDRGITTEDNIRHIIRSTDGRILVASLRGLLQYDRKRDRFITVQNSLCNDPDCHFSRGLYELPDKRFINATYGGLFLLTPDLKPISRTDPNGTYFGCMYFDPSTSQLYASRRDQDLVVYQYEQGRLVHQYTTLPGYNIMAIHPDPARGCLWLCTDRGFVRFDPASKRAVRTYTIRDGLPDDVIYELLPDRKGRFWLSTNNGLVKFSPDDHSFSPIMSTKGREYNSHAALVGSDGTFYFGGVHGLDHFIPDLLEAFRANVPVRIVNFQVNNQPYKSQGFIGETKEVQLSYRQNTITIGLAALDYFSNGKNRFFYRLLDIDQDWIPLTDANQVRYADLSPGNYVFQAKAIDAGGRFTPITELYIRIHPPFWKRWWFWLAGLLISLGLLSFAIISYNQRKLARQRRLLRNTLATQEEERRRIARDLHDDLGNTLATIKGSLELAKERMAGIASIPEVIRAYELIDKASNDLRTITHDLMPIEFEKYPLPDIVAQLVERVNSSSRINFEFILFGNVCRLKPERELIVYRIIAELVQNALKHGGEGTAIVQLGYHAEQLSILIETPLTTNVENSFFSDQIKTGIGQKNITFRAEYLQAELVTDSNEESYIVMLDVPYDSTRPQANYNNNH